MRSAARADPSFALTATREVNSRARVPRGKAENLSAKLAACDSENPRLKDLRILERLLISLIEQFLADQTFSV